MAELDGVRSLIIPWEQMRQPGTFLAQAMAGINMIDTMGYGIH